MTQIVLIGLMGAGKTTVGRHVAATLGRAYVDSDLYIESITGRTVKQILAAEGEAAMRAAEAEALFATVALDTPVVIGCAAGFVLDPANVAWLQAARESGEALVVWLDGAPEVLATRTASRGHRPFVDDDPVAVLRAMHQQRAPIYRELADLVVDVTPGGRPGDAKHSAAMIAEWFADRDRRAIGAGAR